MSTPTAHELRTDIITLYQRGYSKALRALPVNCESVPIEGLRAALRAAGFSDAEIDQRDYSRALEVDA